jgi:hypothetical protein
MAAVYFLPFRHLTRERERERKREREREACVLATDIAALV